MKKCTTKRCNVHMMMGGSEVLYKLMLWLHLRKYTTLAKKIETGTQAKQRRVHARQITHRMLCCPTQHLCRVCAVVSIFLARVVVTEMPVPEWTFQQTLVDEHRAASPSDRPSFTM